MSVLCAYKRAPSLVLRPHKILPSPALAHHRLFHSTPHYRLNTMSVNIVLPDLPNFVQGRITALYTAKTPAEFDSAFDAFVAEDARITLNGKHISRANYKKTIMGEIANDVSANVQFQGVVSVPADTTGKDLNAIGVSRASPHVLHEHPRN